MYKQTVCFDFFLSEVQTLSTRRPFYPGRVQMALLNTYYWWCIAPGYGFMVTCLVVTCPRTANNCNESVQFKMVSMR